MPGTKIQKYIIREILSPTLLCMLIFTMVLLMGRLMKLVDLVVNKGVSITDILVLFGTLLPAFLNITLPLSFLMGIMIGLSRMSADSETIAMKAAGIGLAQMARPILALAVVFSLLTAVAGLWLKPWGYQAFREQVFAITMQKATIGFQPQVFMKQFNNMVLYANDLDARTGQMNGLFIVEKKPDTTTLIFAEQGDIVADEQEETITVQLQDGTIHRQKADDDSAYQLINFRSYDVQPDLTSNGEEAAEKIGKEKAAQGDVNRSTLATASATGREQYQPAKTRRSPSGNTHPDGLANGSSDFRPVRTAIQYPDPSIRPQRRIRHRTGHIPLLLPATVSGTDVHC